MRRDNETTTRRNQTGPRDGRLSPWADAATDAPGWQITTPSRRLAVAVAIPGGTVQSHEKGQWQARIPHTVITVAVIGTDADALWCHLSTRPDSGIYVLAFAPWSAATVLKCPLTTLPAHGRLSVRDVRVTTRMGRTIRFLIPAFTMP